MGQFHVATSPTIALLEVIGNRLKQILPYFDGYFWENCSLTCNQVLIIWNCAIKSCTYVSNRAMLWIEKGAFEYLDTLSPKLSWQKIFSRALFFQKVFMYIPSSPKVVIEISTFHVKAFEILHSPICLQLQKYSINVTNHMIGRYYVRRAI